MSNLASTWQERSEAFLEKARNAESKVLQAFYTGSAISYQECAEELQRTDHEQSEKQG